MVQYALPLTGVADIEIARRPPRKPKKACAAEPRHRLVAVLPGQLDIWQAVAANANARAAVVPVQRRRRQAAGNGKRLTRAELRVKAELDTAAPMMRMPRSSAECEAAGLGETVPCPFVRCRYHLSIEVMSMGALRVIYPHWEDGADEGAPTCTLAQARKGEHVASQIGAILGIGIDRVGQIERAALAKLGARFGMTPGELRRAMAQRQREG